TEMITGIDLVKEQVKIARGERLSFTQEDLQIKGHAIELRVYAEDPTNNFLPDIGTLEKYQIPVGEGIRVDDGFEEGMTIPIYYDPMIAKLVVHAPNREAALKKMIIAIDNYQIEGIANTLEFGKFVMQHPAFISGDFDTHFVKNYFTPDTLQNHNETEAKIAAFIATQVFQESKRQNTIDDFLQSSNGNSKWKVRRRV
ncbi:MAG: biotin carboxylase, partial [Chitinophagales bacterium]